MFNGNSPPDLEHFAHTQSERYKPLLPGRGFPVSRNDRGHGDIKPFYNVVIDKILDQHLVYIGPVAVACKRPEVVCQYPEDPVAIAGE